MLLKVPGRKEGRTQRERGVGVGYFRNLWVSMCGLDPIPEQLQLNTGVNSVNPTSYPRVAVFQEILRSLAQIRSSTALLVS